MQRDGAVWALLALVFFLNRNPYWGWNDALGFGADAVWGWSLYTNATSHFLYTNLLHMLLSVFYFLDGAFVATTFSVLCGLATAWQMKRIASAVGATDGGARLLMVVWALSFTFWQQSESVEVYAFNCLLASQFLLLSLQDLVRCERSNWVWVSILLGLGFLTHIQWILALPFFGYYLFFKANLYVFQRVVAGVLAGSVVSVLLIVPLATGNNSVSAVFFDNRFQDDVLGFQWFDLAKGLLKGFAYFLYNFHVFAVLVLWSWWRMFREKWTLRWPLVLFVFPFWAFASKYGVSDNHVFYLVPYMALILPLCLVVVNLLAKNSIMKVGSSVFAFAFPFFLYGMTTWAVRQTAFGKRYDSEKAYKGGVTHVFWPGRARAKDPLALARHYLEHDPGAFGRGEIEWNYPDAVRLLQARRK